MTPPDRLKVLGSTLEALGSRQCSPATEAQHRGRNDTELSPKQQDPTKRFGRRNQGPAETEVSPSRQNYRKIWAIQDTEVTPRDRFEGTWQYIRRYLAADSAARRLKPYTEAELSPKQQDPTKKFGRKYQGPSKET